MSHSSNQNVHLIVLIVVLDLVLESSLKFLSHFLVFNSAFLGCNKYVHEYITVVVASAVLSGVHPICGHARNETRSGM
jgi:hypothetical protein